MKIKNAQDLAIYLGAHDAHEKSISRCVYEDTTCGAWAKLEDALPMDTPTLQEWKVDIRRSILGPIVRRARRAKGRKWYAPNEFPRELVECIGGMKESINGRWFLTGQEEIAYVNENPLRGRRYYDCAYTGHRRKFRPGVSFGSIVEGVEETTSVHSVTFPCYSFQIDKAIQAVEDEAEEIWMETHGCSECGDPDEYNDGHTRVNPECKVCGGHGVVI